MAKQPAGTIKGTAKNDVIVGTEFDDYILGLRGDDNLSGLNGNDRIVGGAGNDTIIGGLGNDTIEGGDGNDKLTGGSGSDTILGGNGNDLIFHDFTVAIPSEFDSYDGGTNVVKGNKPAPAEADILSLTLTQTQYALLSDALAAFSIHNKAIDFHFHDYVSWSNLTIRNIEQLALNIIPDPVPVANNDNVITTDISPLPETNLFANDINVSANTVLSVYNVDLGGSTYFYPLDGSMGWANSLLPAFFSSFPDVASDSNVLGLAEFRTSTNAWEIEFIVYKNGLVDPRLVGGSNFEYLPLGKSATFSFDYNIMDGMNSSNAHYSLTVNGQDNNDINVVFNNNNNVLYGGVGNDILKVLGTPFGNNGTLDGGPGNDTLTGHTGATVFNFSLNDPSGASDTVTNFSTAKGDVLRFSDVLDTNNDSVVNIQDLQSSCQNSGSDTIVTYTTNTGTADIHLLNISIASLSELAPNNVEVMG